MTGRLELNFSLSFDGKIWNTVAVPQKNILFFELRDDKKRQVSFSAFMLDGNNFLWQNVQLKERWWVGLLAAKGSVVLFHTYSDTGSPGGGGITAMDIHSREILWSKENFTFQDFTPTGIAGFFRDDLSLPVLLEPSTGEVIAAPGKLESGEDEIFEPLQPFQYQEGTSYFETVRSFLADRFSVEVLPPAEYLEYNGLIIVSYYKKEDNGLTNFLLVSDMTGNVLLHEKMEEELKGAGMGTFFVLSGCLFFVRKRSEFLSYKII